MRQALHFANRIYWRQCTPLSLFPTIHEPDLHLSIYIIFELSSKLGADLSFTRLFVY